MECWAHSPRSPLPRNRSAWGRDRSSRSRPGETRARCTDCLRQVHTLQPLAPAHCLSSDTCSQGRCTATCTTPRAKPTRPLLVQSQLTHTKHLVGFSHHEFHLCSCSVHNPRGTVPVKYTHLLDVGLSFRHRERSHRTTT
eukprot:482030-Rhodomonas_salina.3